MRIKNVSHGDLIAALEKTNESFDGNIVFKSVRPANRSGTIWNVTLAVRGSYGKGARRSQSGRRMTDACWHAYGTFMDSLPDGAVFYSPVVVYDAWGREKTKRVQRQPGDPWEDWNIGSVMSPLYYSEACDCD